MKTLFALVAACVAWQLPALAMSQDPGCDCQAGCNSCGHRCPSCPKCSNKICTSTVEPTKEEHHCFNVECKEICVPKITLPCWTDAIPFFKCKDKSCGCGPKCPTKECCDAPRCGYVKVVKVLKKHEYECDSCGYKWTMHEAPCCDAPCAGACAAGAQQQGAPYQGEQTVGAPVYQQPPLPPQYSMPAAQTQLPVGRTPSLYDNRANNVRFAK